jgi:hypothetical protein
VESFERLMAISNYENGCQEDEREGEEKEGDRLL